MGTGFGAGFHAPLGKVVDASAYDRWTGRWSRLFVPAVLSAAAVEPRSRVLDVSTGTGEAARMALPIVGTGGFVVGADISHAMLTGARERLNIPSFLPVVADGQALPFTEASFDAVVCQLGLQFFPDPARGVGEFRRVLRKGGRVAICVISTPDRAPMWGNLADVLSRFLPELSGVLYLSFGLHDPNRLEAMLMDAGFSDVRVERTTREDSFDGFADYWEPIEAGVGSIPQAYLTLGAAERRAVREEVRSRLSRFESNNRLRMSVEMLIGSGRVQ
ncbi:MAG TPA: methyltransferase domain-containing protein [Stellaceae bacterium]|nr:methyltransferase domain-containing protein [Stellaceae bacterium]